jgi:hypothetical protein
MVVRRCLLGFEEKPRGRAPPKAGVTGSIPVGHTMDNLPPEMELTLKYLLDMWNLGWPARIAMVLSAILWLCFIGWAIWYRICVMD